MEKTTSKHMVRPWARKWQSPFLNILIIYILNFKAHLLQRGYPEDLINTTLSEVNFKDRKLALQQKPKTNQRILPFVTQYQPSVPNLKQILMKNWHLIEQQPLLSEIYKKPPLVSYKRGRSLKDILVRAKL